MDREAIKSHMFASQGNDVGTFTNPKLDSDNDPNNNNDNDNNSNNNSNNTNEFEFDPPSDPLPQINGTININEREKAFCNHIAALPCFQLLVEINLMNIMTKHKLPLNTFQAIFQWTKD
eukprot:1485749-Ditylum_brightwellii.AAC.1